MGDIMNIIRASDFGIKSGEDATLGLCALFESACAENGEKTVLFDKGTYYISAEKCRRKRLVITNTVSEKEFSAGEKPHINEVPFYFENAQDLTVDGGGSLFVISGKATNMAAVGCKNLKIKNIELRHSHPDMHELTVISKTAFSVDFKVDGRSLYEIKNKTLYFYGNGYRCAANQSAANARWIGLVRLETPNTVKRVSHPLIGAFGGREIKKGVVRFYFPSTMRFRKGDRFSIFDVRRQYAGIFLDSCENVALENIKQRFNYSLALVAQSCENVSVENVEFAPEENCPVSLASVADFMQICMCRGRVEINNSRFEGAGDDCLNVHGIHFKIASRKANTLTVRFMHPQTYGFNPIRKGDTVAFINCKTLLEEARSRVLDSHMAGDYELILELDCADGFSAGGVIEDISACPDVSFTNNTVNRIITRGLLLTTRGEVRVSNNRFISTSMSGILLSDDAESWYESGMCTDVLIENNEFLYCGAVPILIKPENHAHAGAVHRNIRLKGNVFKKYKGVCISAKSADSIEIRGNKFTRRNWLRQKNCTNTVCADNKIREEFYG